MLNVYIKDPSSAAQACVIWMHGLGANANDMKGLVAQLPLDKPVRHVFIDAPVRPVTLNNRMPMRAWYDIVGMKLTDREDREGIFQSEAMIRQVIENQLKDGFQSTQIFLAGFSQGSAMALFTGLRSPKPLGGIIALSGYLPLVSDCTSILDKRTPMFIACGRFDPVVLPDWTKQSYDWLKACGFQNLAWHDYPMEHNICVEEIRDLAHWFSSEIISITSYDGVTE